jgi:hypothetical protein
MLTRAVLCACASVLVASPLHAQIAIDQGIQIMRAPGGVPQREGQPARTGTARIRGRVVAADTGLPIRRGVVRATSVEVRENRSTVTDAEGRYEFRELPAASYTLNASKSSFVALSYGQTRPFDSGRPLELKDSQTIERIDFRLPRGGVIAGRILDELGEPVSDVQVMTMRNQFAQGRRQPTPYGRPAMTNDIGEFRLFGLPPGEYYISATARDLSAMMATSDDRSGYAPTYYPGTPNAAEAQLVAIAVGESQSDLTLILVPIKTGRITGTALDSEGKPIRGGNVMVTQTMRGGDMAMSFMSSSGSTIKPDGSFSISGVAPGEYQLRAMAFGSGPAMAEASMATVSVAGGEDITGVVLLPQRPAAAQGRIVVNPPDPTGQLEPSGIRLMATPTVPSGPMFGGAGAPPTIRGDWSFEMSVPPGMMNIRAVPSIPGWTVKAVRHNGTDVTDTGIDFPSGGTVEGLEIELTNLQQEISGRVTNDKGLEVKDYSVLFFPQDRTRWELMRYFAIGRPNQEGRYSVRTLPPGEYLAAAVEYLDPSERANPELLDRLRIGASPIEIREGDAKALDLRIRE